MAYSSFKCNARLHALLQGSKEVGRLRSQTTVVGGGIAPENIVMAVGGKKGPGYSRGAGA